jgi:hypothetical protein
VRRGGTAVVSYVSLACNDLDRHERSSPRLIHRDALAGIADAQRGGGATFSFALLPRRFMTAR